MRAFDPTMQRLFVGQPLATGEHVELDASAAHYIVNVLRLTSGQDILVFNGRDGEWRAQVGETRKKRCVLLAVEKMREQEAGPDLDYLFAPLKRARLDYMVQKATELGVARLMPIMTARTIAERVNLERMRANAVEAAEQCGILRIPEVHEPRRLSAVLDAWPSGRRLVFCDESAAVANPLAVLEGLPRGPIAVLIGPEGGFTPDERSSLLRHPCITAISLGPRIMRADTAAMAALTLVNAVLGDWGDRQQLSAGGT